MSYVGAIVVGAICIVLGILNMRGNISSLHSYHRHRVSEEDRITFGKKIGLGTVICGASILAFGALSAVSQVIDSDVLRLISTAIMVVGIIVGLVLIFWAMIKYNKGIF